MIGSEVEDQFSHNSGGCPTAPYLNSRPSVANDKTFNLQETKGEQTVYVEFGIKLTKKDLQDIPCARKIESFNEGWLIESDEDVDLRKEIAQFAQTKQWLVLTLKVERKSLEDVFKQLTK